MGRCALHGAVGITLASRSTSCRFESHHSASAEPALLQVLAFGYAIKPVNYGVVNYIQSLGITINSEQNRLGRNKHNECEDNNSNKIYDLKADIVRTVIFV